MSKSEASIKEIFNILSSNGITPNQFYLLCSMKESISPALINVHTELRHLKSDGTWVTDDNKLTQKSLELIDKVDSFFTVSKKKTTGQLLGPQHSENIKKYSELFPNIKLPHGKAARSDKRNIENNFRWFFENYEYSWEVVLKATAIYVDEFERNNWLYMRTSMYFIRKQEQDKTYVSDLANYCAIVESGGSFDTGHHFSDKVF